MRAAVTNEFQGWKWEEGNIESAKQNDGHSCGSFVMMVSPLLGLSAPDININNINYACHRKAVHGKMHLYPI